ncbi:MAG: glycosyltransferase [Pirellula sp.]
MRDLSIVICAHNAAKRILPVLNALSQQRADGVKWETIVVANACTDETERVALEFGQSHSLEVRVVVEPKPGLSHARRRGVEEACGRIISFVDDDNIVRENWVANCVRFMEANPKAGVVGGRIKPRFVDPASKPFDFDERFAGALACWDHGDHPMRYPPPVYYPPCGAGLTMRRETLLYIFRECGCHLSDRTGSRLISGGDYELGLLALKMGGEAWYTPELEMEHVLPPGRLTDSYLKKLQMGNVQSEFWLNYLSGKMPQCSRRWYLKEAVLKQVAALRCKVFTFRGRGSAANETIAEEHTLRAQGAWRLFKEYPFERVERAIARYRNSSSIINS